MSTVAFPERAMTEESLHIPRLALQRALAQTTWLVVWRLVQTGALAAAAFFTYRGAQILDQDPQTVQFFFDEGAPWLGLALLATLVAAWEPALPRLSRPWSAMLADVWRAHRLELALLALIFAFGVFMRVYRFGDTLPPADALCCEEHINGGVAFMVREEGVRPLSFPLVRWASAAGFWLFGENTFGLRFFFVAMGIATLVPFYLLLRQLVRPPVALFGLALYAAAWWPSLFNRQTSEGTILTIIFALLLVRGLKTRSTLAFWALGLVAGLVSYEYEAFRQVPMIAAGFVAAGAVWALLLRQPVRLDALAARARALAKVAWRPALIFVFACGITLTPLIIGIREGQDLYLGSLHRQEQNRAGERLAPNWRDQVRWAVQVYLPVGPNEYPTQLPPVDLWERPALDPLSGWLALAGLAAGIVSFWRPFRLLFVGWFVLTLAAGALLAHAFAPWKVIGLVPVALILGALFVDDLGSLLRRLFARWGSRAFTGLLVAGAAFSFWWNADTLYNKVAPEAQQAYANANSFYYAYCNYLRERGPANYSATFETAYPPLGFARPRQSVEQQVVAWSDFVWVCHSLRGQALPAAEEAWPLQTLPAGPFTLAFSLLSSVFPDMISSPEELIGQLNRAYPGLGQPDRVIPGPKDLHLILGYEFADGRELARYRGLWGEYLPPGARQPALARIDPVSNLSWEERGLPLTPPFTLRWRGVVYLDSGGLASLQAVTADPVEVKLDGQVIYSTLEGAPQGRFMELFSGWHVVEITIDKQQPGGGLSLNWVTPDGERQFVHLPDLFPLVDLQGWVHQRTIGTPLEPPQITQRFDFAPHFSSAAVLKSFAHQPANALVREERWRGVWEVDEPGSYLLSATFLGGEVTLLLDGVPVATGTTQSQFLARAEAQVAVRAGRHVLELVQQLDTDVVWSGATLSAWLTAPPSGEADALAPTRLRVLPY